VDANITRGVLVYTFDPLPQNSSSKSLNVSPFLPSLTASSHSFSSFPSFPPLPLFQVLFLLAPNPLFYMLYFCLLCSLFPHPSFFSPFPNCFFSALHLFIFCNQSHCQEWIQGPILTFSFIRFSVTLANVFSSL
jgi:hypothetical protein